MVYEDQICSECGNDLVCEGYEHCTECLVDQLAKEMTYVLGESRVRRVREVQERGWLDRLRRMFGVGV